jgi:hypothetical protein
MKTYYNITDSEYSILMDDYFDNDFSDRELASSNLYFSKFELDCIDRKLGRDLRKLDYIDLSRTSLVITIYSKRRQTFYGGSMGGLNSVSNDGSVSLSVLKLKDEWYIAYDGHQAYYKCDQLDGLLDLIGYYLSIR